jgi:AcrR family transcriptional regulator
MSARAAKRKGQRSYDSSGRQERARQQREATLEYARQLFLDLGYAATTVETIAEATGVSTATIYKTYGGKAGLVRELWARALAGAGPVPAEERSDALRTDDDPRAVIAGWGALTTEVAPRSAPLFLVLRSAAQTDREAAALLAEFEQGRLDRMADNTSYLVDGGHLRAGVTADEARDVLWTCSSAELYELLVLRRGWTPERFGTFVADTMTGTLLR